MVKFSGDYITDHMYTLLVTKHVCRRSCVLNRFTMQILGGSSSYEIVLPGWQRQEWVAVPVLPRAGLLLPPRYGAEGHSEMMQLRNQGGSVPFFHGRGGAVVVGEGSVVPVTDLISRVCGTADSDQVGKRGVQRQVCGALPELLVRVVPAQAWDAKDDAHRTEEPPAPARERCGANERAR